jgi:hypothetical protein
VFEVERGDRGFEQGCEDVAAAGDALELVTRDLSRALGEPLAEPEVLRDERAAGPRDDMRTDLREAALGRLAEPVEDGARDRELEDAVAQELEPLIGVGAIVRPGRVLEDLPEAFGRKLGDQPSELTRPVGLRAGAR